MYRSKNYADLSFLTNVDLNRARIWCEDNLAIDSWRINSIDVRLKGLPEYTATQNYIEFDNHDDYILYKLTWES